MESRYEYKVVPITTDDLQALLDENAKDGWRLVETYQSMGYTVRLIFERQII